MTSKMSIPEQHRKSEEEVERENLEIDGSPKIHRVFPVYVRESPIIQYQLQEMSLEKKKSSFSLLKLRCYNWCCFKSSFQPPAVVFAPSSVKPKAADDQAKFKLWQASLQPSATKRK